MSDHASVGHEPSPRSPGNFDIFMSRLWTLGCSISGPELHRTRNGAHFGSETDTVNPLLRSIYTNLIVYNYDYILLYTTIYYYIIIYDYILLYTTIAILYTNMHAMSMHVNALVVMFNDIKWLSEDWEMRILNTWSERRGHHALLAPHQHAKRAICDFLPSCAFLNTDFGSVAWWQYLVDHAT